MPTEHQTNITSKQGEPIQEGEHVYTKYRGGRHEGDVSIILAPASSNARQCSQRE
ncbi:hypothetical protein M011DRAFT_472132 [Sporormia fimetaria CBS 119925]|uniref:Hypervirulence associated protein TUDOR domain-containing protein n=1 Tax=Sporormia fimetaria CBS 119925 TaxID=1340428 RepID=A0A6A6UZQ4_9PLEO|nr:hypothetical protein M011DRAFT_472132 [Sporormia fimetaria CBS 119925]